MKKLLPLILAVMGLGGGVMAGAMMKPAPAPEAGSGADAAGAEPAPAAEPAPDVGDPLNPDPAHDPSVTWDYTKLDRQFVVPVMDEARVAALVVLSISIEVAPGSGPDVLAREPKLRDAFLRVLFEHERAGGFAGPFTDARVMNDLRGALRVAAQGIVGKSANDVLVTDLLRQDL